MKTLTRDVQVRAAEGKREFTGIAVPYNDEIEYFDYFDGTEREAFEPGAIANAEGCKVFWRHNEVIGVVTGHRDTKAGWEIDGKISDTTLGRDAYALLQDGAITQLSIGFEPLEHRITEDGLKVWTKVRAREVSLVPNPAYENALISGIRNEQKENSPMDITAQVKEAVTAATGGINDELDGIRQALATINNTKQEPTRAVPFESFGAYVRAAAKGEEAALQFHRDFTGGTSADGINLPTWADNLIRLVEDKRKVKNMFQTAALPPEGLNLEFAKLKTNSISVAQQEHEGDDLVFGKVDLITDTTPVKTYGGYSSLSRQAIERTTVSVLDTMFQAFAIAYASATEAAVRKVITDHLDTAAAETPLKLAGADVFAHLDAVVDASDLFAERGYNLEGLAVSKDVFKKMARLTDGTGDPIFHVYGQGVNRVGSLDLTGLTGNLANLPVVPLHGAPENTMAAFDHVAVKTWESPGAPFQLQDENIVNLTKDFSVYGYLASAVQHPGALVPITANEG